MTEKTSAVEVLLVEDNPGDVRLTEEALKESKHEVKLSVAEDGEVAMARLRKEGEFADSARPDLILLDLNLPGKDGQEVLVDINADEDLRSIPVMILTGTTAEQSLLQSYGIPPARFIRKPIDVGRFDATMTMLQSFSHRPIQVPGARAASASKKRWWWPF